MYGSAIPREKPTPPRLITHSEIWQSDSTVGLWEQVGKHWAGSEVGRTLVMLPNTARAAGRI